MKRKVILSMVVAAMVLGMVPMVALAGNDAPPGQHYNLNIIGVPNPKNVNFDGGNGSRVFVLRTGATKFYVHGGDSYNVVDHDGTDGEVGTGPNPDSPDYQPGIIFPYSDGQWRVEIYVRLVGPNSDDNNLGWTSSYWDGDFYVPWASFNLDKSSKFALKTGDLLKDGYQDILWELQPGTKFRICQLRIYLVEVEE